MDNMNDLFPVLIELQGILAQKIEVQKEIDNLPKSLEEKKYLVDTTKNSYDRLSIDLDEVKAEVTSLRIRLDQVQREHEKFQMQASEIHNAREFEILNKDIEDAKARETELRNALKEKEKKEKEVNTSLVETLEKLKEYENEFNKASEEINSILEEKKAKLNELLAQEKKHTPKIDASQLFKFERIIANKNGEGIVAVHNVVCEGCHMTLPRQFVNEVRKAQTIHYCPYCSRILYFEESSDDDMDFASTSLLDEDEDSLLD